ncbi:MAG: hypothetical protein KatS3mg058_0932 [Roseiflexus sp.]|nr:MAG: hypothetical protein KatS3mg058_0932 [Roseiflexus sp.]
MTEFRYCETDELSGDNGRRSMLFLMALGRREWAVERSCGTPLL